MAQKRWPRFDYWSDICSCDTMEESREKLARAKRRDGTKEYRVVKRTITEEPI